MGTNQGDRQASVRGQTGTALTYEGDFHALFTQAGVPAGDFNGRLLAWINSRLGTTYSELNGAMVAFAVNQGFTSWGAMGTFDASGVPAAPTNTVAPSIYGPLYVGSTLTASTGTWTGDPTITYARQWYRADPLTSGGDVVTYNGSPVTVTASVISGATASTYVLTDSDVNMIVWERITATNGAGSVSSDSVATGPVASAAPAVNLLFSTYSSESDLASATPPVTFTRSTTGTRFNSSGLLVTEAVNGPRFDHDPATLAAIGLRIDEARTNVCLYSQDMTNASWLYPDVAVTTGFLAPDDTNNATLLTPSTAGSIKYIIEAVGRTASAVSTHSVFVKAAGYSKIALRESATSGAYASFDLATASVLDSASAGGFTVSNPKIIAVGNGGYRISVTIASVDSYRLGLWLLPPGYTAGQPSSSSWSGDGASGVYAWGAQLELGSFATSFIPTTSAAVTRSADIASFTIPSGVTNIRTTYSDNTTADTPVTPLATYNIPTGALAVKSIVSI